MSELKDAAEKIEKLLRLKTFIIGLQFFEQREKIETVPKIRRPEGKRVFCQIITTARTYGWTMGVSSENLIPNSFCNVMLGFTPKPKFMSDGTYKGAVWFENEEEARKYEKSIPVIPPGKIRAVAIGPISAERLKPDLVLTYGNPAQLMILINAMQWKDYERLTFYCTGESSCADAVAQSYLSGKAALTIPCYGERRFGHAQDDEMVLAMQPDTMVKASEGLERLADRGIRYPIPFFGVQADPSEGMPEVFKRYHALAPQDEEKEIP